jgi:hypothetical protein
MLGQIPRGRSGLAVNAGLKCPTPDSVQSHSDSDTANSARRERNRAKLVAQLCPRIAGHLTPNEFAIHGQVHGPETVGSL